MGVTFGLLVATAAQSQIPLAFQGGEPGDAWSYTSTLASAIAIGEAAQAPNKTTGTTSLVVGGNTGGGSCFSGGSGNGPSTPRTFTFSSVDISSSNESTRTLTFNWGNRFPSCNGTGWDAGENLVFTPYHNGVAQAPVTIVAGNNNAAYSIQSNQYTWTIPPCINSFSFVVSVTTNRADELLFLDDVRLTAPQLNTSTAQPSAIAGAVTICANGTENYSVTGVAGATYTWSGLPAGAQFTTPNGTASSNNITVDWGTAAAGTYTLSVTASNACGAVSPAQTISVTIAGPATPLTISGPTSFCPGDVITLSSNYASGNTWSTSDNTQSISVFLAGTYTVTVQTACSTLTASQTVTENANTPATITAGGPTTFCAGNTLTLTSSSASGNTWSTGETTSSIQVSASGTYTLSVADVCGPSTASEQVTVQPLPVAAIGSNGPLDICPGDSVLLIASGGDTYSWSNGALGNATYVHTPGNYSVVVSNACGSDNSDTLVVTLLAGVSAQITGSTSACTGDSVLLTASGGSTYTWSTGATGTTFYAIAPGTYTVTANSQCGTATSAPVTVSTIPGPTANITGNTSFCAGDSVLLTASGGTSYVWSTGATGSAIYATTAGTYTVTATNQCGSVVSAPLTITVTNGPTAQISGNASYCEGDSTLLTASGGTGYLWSTGATSTSIYVTSPGIYTVGTANQCGQAISAPFTVTESPLPVAQISGNTTFCPGQSVQLTASGGAGYQWSTGAQTTAISVNTSGTYSVTTGNACGTDVASVTVTEVSIQAHFTASPLTGNAPLPVDFTNSSSANAVTTDWTFGDGATANSGNPSHTYMNEGEYTVTLLVTSAEGCTDSENLLITVLNMPSSLTIPNVFTPNGDGSNDFFVVEAERLENYHLLLFNRWGNLLRETTDWQDGWDGTINGEKASEGTYFYQLEAIGLDRKAYKQSGFFELVR